MAARENQGFIIGIIVLAILTVILLVTTVFSTMKAYESHDKMVAAVEDSAYQKSLANAYTAKADMLSATLGLEGTSPTEITTFRDLITNQKRNAGDKAGDIQQIADSAQSIYEIYEKDMAFNAAITDGQPGGDADNTYKGTIDKIASALRSQTENAFDKTKETKRILAETEQAKATLTNTLNERTKALNQTEQDLAAEKQRNKRAEDQLIEQAKSIQDSKDTLQAEFEDQKSALQNTIATTKNDLQFVVKQNDALKTKINEYERQVFDSPDGEIVQVAASGGSVFIDLGRLDGVRTNLTFAIYDRTATDFEKDRHKATIEVTEILGDHRSKARVTEENPLDPILAKDKILSATFDRGDTVAVALGGFFDIDNDGISDLKRLKRMIENNGGRIVASHDENGNITGEIDSTTRYFVLGPPPQGGSSRNVVTAMATMQKQAEGNSVDTIDINKLLAWMGVSRRAKIERLDNRLGENGFQPRSPLGSGAGSSSRGAAGSGSR